ncbi:hypothetical protein ACR20V_004262 [Salmonella enterica]
MILAVIGGTPDQHVDLYMQLNQAIGKGYAVDHVKNHYSPSGSNVRKIRRAISEKRGDTVTLITGIKGASEIEALYARRLPPVFCVMPGPLPARLLSRVVFGRDWLLVAPHPSELETPEKQRRYCTITEAFSECFARKREFFLSKGRSNRAGS